MTMAILGKEAYRDDDITEIMDLQYLKRYACPKVQHKKDWSLECVKCKSRKGCRAGEQAYFLLNNMTTPTANESAQDAQKRKQREMIERIFRKDDPVLELLKTSGNVKPQSIYQKVYTWQKNYPDLEAQYSMLAKVRFLWTKPYDCMTVPDILASLYPEEAEKMKSTNSAKPVQIADAKKEIQKKAVPDISRKEEKMPVVKAVQKNPEEDEVSLDEFLKEMDLREPEKPKANERASEQILRCAQNDTEERAKNDPGKKGDLDCLIGKLKAEKELLTKRLQDLDADISRVLAVQELMQKYQ